MGLCLIWCTVLLDEAPLEIQPLLIVLALGLVIALIFNLRERLFLGDSGVYALSIFIGLLAIYSYIARYPQLPAETVMIWFLIPVLDCLRLMAKRVFKGRSPLSADKDHLHHLLLSVMPYKWALISYLLLVGIPSVLAVVLPRLNIYWIALSVIFYLTIFVMDRMRVLR